MNHWIQKIRWAQCIASRWIVMPTIALITIGGSPAAAQNDLSEVKLSPPTEFKQLSRFGLGVKSPGGGQPKPQRSEEAQSLVNRHRITSIHERIALIKRLIEQEKAQAQRRQENSLPDSAAANGGTSGQPTDPQPSDATTNPTEPQAATTEPGTPPVDGGSGTPVVSQPINPFELANSLFVTGNIVASRRSYEAGLADATPEDRLWLKCLIGCCYRLEGDFANAETSFREVTSHQGFAYPAEYAKWCLKYLEQRRNSAEQFQVIETELDNLLTELPNNDGT